MRRLLVVFFVIVAPLLSRGDDETITVPPGSYTFSASQPLRLNQAAQPYRLDAWAITAPAGTYTFVSLQPVRISHPSATSVLLDWGSEPPGPNPPPVPPPGPNPPPVPPPTQGILHVTAVFDVDSITPEQAQIRSSTTIAPALKALNAVWRTYEWKSSDLDRLNLRATVQATGTPCVIVQDEKGKMVRAVKIANETDILNLVKGLR